MSKQDRDRHDKMIKKSGSVIRKIQDTFETHYQRRLTNKLTYVIHDDTPTEAEV